MFEEGEWAHVAVSFTENGVTVYVDGEAIPNNQWQAHEGDHGNPSNFKEAYLMQNEEPWKSMKADAIRRSGAGFQRGSSNSTNAYNLQKYVVLFCSTWLSLTHPKVVSVWKMDSSFGQQIV